MMNGLRRWLKTGPEGWIGVWLSLILTWIVVFLAGFDISSFKEMLKDNWELFVAMFSSGLGLNVWHRKNKMRYEHPGEVVDPEQL